jgi:hypothetical protein
MVYCSLSWVTRPQLLFTAVSIDFPGTYPLYLLTDDKAMLTMPEHTLRIRSLFRFPDSSVGRANDC